MALYISTLAVVSPSEVKPPITYTSLSRFAEVTSVLEVGSGIPLAQSLFIILSYAIVILIKLIGCNARNNENETRANIRFRPRNPFIILKDYKSIIKVCDISRI